MRLRPGQRAEGRAVGIFILHIWYLTDKTVIMGD